MILCEGKIIDWDEVRGTGCAVRGTGDEVREKDSIEQWDSRTVKQ